MKLFREVIFSLLCYAVYMVLVMWFTYPLIFIAYYFGMSIESINDNFYWFMLGSLGIVLGLTKLVSALILKYKARKG